jgi:hypothetical protein
VTVKTLTFETPSGARLAPLLADRFPGMPDTRNGQITHPFCNTGIKG